MTERRHKQSRRVQDMDEVEYLEDHTDTTLQGRLFGLMTTVATAVLVGGMGWVMLIDSKVVAQEVEIKNGERAFQNHLAESATRDKKLDEVIKLVNAMVATQAGFKEGMEALARTQVRILDSLERHDERHNNEGKK